MQMIPTVFKVKSTTEFQNGNPVKTRGWTNAGTTLFLELQISSVMDF